MDFGQALATLKNGGRVTRPGWNGKGMFLYLVPGSTFTVNRPPLLGIYPEGTQIDYRSHIDMKTADGSCVPWAASQTDILADDWGTFPAGATIQLNVTGNTVMSDSDVDRLTEKIGRRLAAVTPPNANATERLPVDEIRKLRDRAQAQVLRCEEVLRRLGGDDDGEAGVPAAAPRAPSGAPSGTAAQVGRD